MGVVLSFKGSCRSGDTCVEWPFRGWDCEIHERSILACRLAVEVYLCLNINPAGKMFEGNGAVSAKVFFPKGHPLDIEISF